MIRLYSNDRVVGVVRVVQRAEGLEAQAVFGDGVQVVRTQSQRGVDGGERFLRPPCESYENKTRRQFILIARTKSKINLPPVCSISATRMSRVASASASRVMPGDDGAVGAGWTSTFCGGDGVRSS